MITESNWPIVLSSEFVVMLVMKYTPPVSLTNRLSAYGPNPDDR